jgi:hypothetical protein
MMIAITVLTFCAFLGVLPTASARAGDSEASVRAARAVAIQTQEQTRLGVLGDAYVCDDARFISYRRSNAEPELADQWYMASQLWADAVLLDTLHSNDNPPVGWDAASTRCYIDKGFIFLDRLWNYEVGGYYPRANPTGTMVEHGPRFADDNSLAGMALLATADTLSEGPTRERYLHAAINEAEFLIKSGLWDTTFGGRFWWNTNAGDTREGKPAQSNALAALFFVRLYDATGNGAYRDWALRTLLWMDTILWDPYHHLYAWSVSYEDLSLRTGAVVNLGEYFNYDQAIAIEAQIHANRLDGDPNRLSRAITLGESIQREFWDQAGGGYNLEAGNEQVYTSYSAWTSLGHIALFKLTRNAHWLDLARANADALDAKFREPDGGVGYAWCSCGSDSVDHTRDTAAQAWAEHLQADLAAADTERATALEGESAGKSR